MHLLASEPAAEPWAVDALLKAAERASSRGAATASLRYLRRALEEPPPADQRAIVLRHLSVVESTLGDPNAPEHAREAMEASEPSERARLAYELSAAYMVARRWSEAIALLEQALEYLSPDDQERRWQLEAQLISLARLDPHTWRGRASI